MQSPLSEGELAELEVTLLPALERHHLRLLAHGLRTLQTIAGRREGALPPLAMIEAWILAQPATAGDLPFARAFASQLQAAGDQLLAIAKPCGVSPLALELSELTTWAQAQAEARLR
ncbi:MAG: hypothetical protein ACKO7Z_02560 [Cyanobacteriota bacterium]